MKTFADNRIVTLSAKTGAAVLAALLVVSICLSVLKMPVIKADSEIMVSLDSNSSNLGPGDIVLIDVLANKMPGITEFGPIKFCFDADKAEYISLEMGKELVNYLHNETPEPGEITINVMDKMMNSDTEGSSDDESSSSLYSDDQVVLFTIALRLFPDCRGEVNCWLSELGEFKAGDTTVEARIGSGLKLPIVRTGPSSDATIAQLKVRGTSITPEFNPNITEYHCSVERSVKEVQISVLASNRWAAVVITGNQQFVLGDNAVKIDVTAQDGINHMVYTIHVVRRESNIPENSSLVDGEGKTYTFLDIPEEVSVPEGFYQTTKTINGYSVPVYVKDGVASVLLYLFDGTRSPGLYFYNINAKTVTPYEIDKTVIKESGILKVVDVPPEIVIPDEFKPATYDTGTIILSGYENEKGEFICYLSDDSGNRDFYYYEKSTGAISRYRFADKKAELLYSYLFDVFLVIAIIEAVIITITVYIVRRMVSDRTNPRPKRV
ncbi:MAG: cadherin-like beta sandwich domain-containing protein [Clostridiales bacterium]|nr:cadherin-like beta sandwich domain-containing protein [Clostridiales bacterium]